MEQYISRAEHDEFAKRMEAENKRLADEDTIIALRTAIETSK